MRRTTYVVVAIIAVAALAASANYWGVHRYIRSILDSDSRNSEIVAFAHYRYFIQVSALVVDLRDVGGRNSPADVFRVLLQFAATQKDSVYKEVVLSFRGTPKFVLTGEYFRQLGVEYGVQNPVYTIRTFPEHLYRPDGRAAFGTWTGGLLGVVGHQMEDFNEFHKQWYIADLATEH